MQKNPPLLRTLALAAVMTASAAYAQSTTQGAVAGTVFDAAGAVVPNASVLVHSNDTNADIKLTSSGSGEFRAPQLIPGSYTITVSAPGFGDVRTNNVVVRVNEVTELTPHLQAASTGTVVEVTAAIPSINFDSPSFGGHLDNREIENIPINNRRWSSLALTTPGVTNTLSGFGLLSFRAISELLNNVQIDGADDNQAFFSEERGRTRAGYSTSQVAVREFQVNTGVYSAEFGRAVGGVVNSVTKTGTNSLHGELYFYNRDDGRAAYQPLAANTTLVNGQYVTSPYKPKDKRNQYGFGIGGPIIKDKLFFFYAFDEFHRNFPGTAKANTPGTFFVNSDLALPAGQTCSATGFTYVSGGKTTTANPGTIQVTATGAAGGSTANNAACLLATRFGQTYGTGATNYNTQLAALLSDLGPVPRQGVQLINTPKLDWQVTPNHHASFLYHRLRWDSPGGVQTQGTNNYAIDTFGTDFVKLDYGVAKLNSIFAGKYTNELRFQYGRELNDEGQQPFSQYTRNNLVGTGGNVPEVALNTSQGFFLGSPYYSYRVAYPDERKWQIGDTAALQLGNHSIRFGEDILHNSDLQNNLYESNGYITYNSTVNYFTDLLNKGNASGRCDTNGSSTGTLPCYGSLAQSFGTPVLTINTTDYGFFVQDDWKIKPRLTLNLGARYDYQSIPNPFAATGSTLAQVAQKPSDKNNISPRVGFAWDPWGQGKTVVRGGFGMYFGRIINATILNAYENSGTTNLGVSQALYSFSPSTAGAPRFPNIGSAPPVAAAGSLGPSVQFLANKLQNPYTEQFDLAVQQDLGKQSVLSISYLGSLGRELPNFVNINLDPARVYTNNYTVTPATGTTNCGPVACGTQFATKVYATKQQTGASTTAYNYVTPQPQFNAVTAVVSNINSSYNALSVDVTNRSYKWVTFDANYTWAHALDYNQNESTSASANNWFDPLANPRSNYGNSSLDTKHRAVGWAIINVPGVSEGNPLKYLTNGFSIKPLVQIQSGLPYSINVSGNAPNQCNSIGCYQSGSSGLSGTGVLYIPQLGRNSQFYPRTILTDLRLQKDFNAELMHQNVSFQLIGEAFNLANHQNVTGLNTTAYNIGSTQAATAAATTSTLAFQPSFGTVTSANSNYAYGPRNIQLALRVLF